MDWPNKVALGVLAAVVVYFASPVAVFWIFYALADRELIDGTYWSGVFETVYAPVQWLSEESELYERYVSWCFEVADLGIP